MVSSSSDDVLVLAPPRADWVGVWVWPEAVDADRNVYAQFRRTFSVATAGTLRVDITADSYYLLFLDGVLLGRGPARAHLEYYSYDSYDIPLTAGAHCLAVLAHHLGGINATVMTGRPGLLVDANAQADGEAVDLSSGDAWRCRLATAWRKDAPAMMSHFGFWEDCDLAQLPEEWTGVKFDDAAWVAPAVIGQPPCAPWTRLSPRDIAPPVYQRLEVARLVATGEWQETQADDAIPSKQAADRLRHLNGVAPSFPCALNGRYLTVDFGRTVSGYVVVECHCDDAGRQLDLSYDELLTPAGAVNPERSYAHLTDRYRLRAGRTIVRPVHPRGFRYVTLDGAPGAAPLTIEAVYAVEETYPFTPQPAFDCPDATLNSFARRGAETVRICTTDAFTDCPTRERVQWMEDLYLHSQVAAYAFADTRMLRRALFQGAQNALPDGRIDGFMPTERTNCAFVSSSILWLQLLAEYRLHAGGDEIAALLPAARRLLELFDSLTDDDGLLASWPAGQFWDWAPIEEAGCLLVTNAALALALQRLAAQPLFTDGLGRELAAQAARLRAAAHARFWDAERRLYRDATPPEGAAPIFSQHGNALAVLAGVCPADERAGVLRRITDARLLGPTPVGEASIRSVPRAAITGIVPVGTLWFAHFVVQACFETGLDVEGLNLMRAFWGAYPDAPTFPETRIQHGNIGCCHGWAGGPAYLLPAYVLGVRPTAPGWQEAVFQPHPGDLAEAHGTLRTPAGTLTAGWRRDGDGLTLTANVPAGMRLRVTCGTLRETIDGPREWRGVTA